MEIFELRYFLGVAEQENIHRASEKLRISPASLSKAIARLEKELSVVLFNRKGRNICLTDQGRLLQRKASKIIQLEEAVRIEVAGQEGTLQVVISGPEILLSKMGLALCQTLKERHALAKFEFHSMRDEAALEQLVRGDAHLAIVTADVDPKAGLSTKTIGEAKFHTYVGQSHPLVNVAKKIGTVTIEEVLRYPFVSPSNPLLGKIGPKQSLDGWRDDQFPRKVDYLTSSLKIIEEMVVNGQAIAYLPDYFCENLSIEALKISDCPYACVQKIKLVARNPKDIGWINQLF